jgi:hypothetical protein
MTADRPTQTSATQPTQHARDLLARLYREIGISAVAAALQIPEQKAAPQTKHELPAILRKDLAA